MARQPGSRNADYAASKRRLLEVLAEAVLTRPVARLSQRELAALAAVSVPTLRHYFGSREALLVELMGFMREQGAVHLAKAASRPIDDLDESLGWLLQSIVLGWRYGVGAIHAFGLSAGMGDATLGPAYVNHLLEPTLQACEARLARHMATGQLPRCDLRFAALRLIAPLLMALIHQDGLFGSRCRPLAFEPFVDDLKRSFLAGMQAARA